MFNQIHTKTVQPWLISMPIFSHELICVLQLVTRNICNRSQMFYAILFVICNIIRINQCI
uniref:Uncharacterized protein n=1 Tax=Anopheles arabiensis TaxID=7173 RepID=A0A182IHS5_ANOAR